MTRPYAEVIGDPIAHSKSPLIHNFWLAKLGIDAEYRKTHVRADELADYFTRRCGEAAWRGCNITIPHKESAAHLVSLRFPGYPDLGAINMVVRAETGLLSGNTDVVGVAAPINAFHDHAFNYGVVPSRAVAIIGAGGAARAAVAAVGSLAFSKSVRLLVRRPEQGRTLAKSMKIEAEVLPLEAASLAGADIIINASPLGMAGQQPMPRDLLLGVAETRPNALVFDMVYAPVETDLLKEAKQLAKPTIDGLQMLVGQAAAAFELFFGQPAPREHDAELRALLTA